MNAEKESSSEEMTPHYQEGYSPKEISRGGIIWMSSTLALWYCTYLLIIFFRP
jgi:hypothetical protein